METLDKLKQLKDLSHSESALRDFILNDIEHFILLKPQQIAEEAFVSLATVYRLADKCECHGITQLKLELASSLKTAGNKNIDVNYPIQPSDSYREIAGSLSHIYQQSIQETRHHFEYEHLDTMASLIRNARYVTVYTTSSNISFAQNFRFQMQEIGINVSVPQDEYSQRVYAANTDETHCAIIISYEGRNPTLPELLRILKETKSKIILITSRNSSPLFDGIDNRIYMISKESHYNKVSSFSSRFSLLYILDMLYSAVFAQDYHTYLDYKRSNYRKLNKYVE